MSLDLNKLEKVRDFAEGKVARCPACAEVGQDRKGEHLRIYPDGKFGCCVHPGDSEHRKRIFALAGQRGRRGITVRVAAAKSSGSVQGGILGRLERVFASPAEAATSADASDGLNEVEPTIDESRTARTGENKSRQNSLDSFRTPRTPPSLLTRIANETESSEKEEKQERELKEFGEGVRSVRDEKQRLPHLLADGTLVIPFDSPERYHYWKGGQSVSETLREVKERMNDGDDF